MPKEYTKDELWKLYEKLPEELKEAIFSEATAESIWNICEKNDVEKVSEVAKYAGQTLLGILPSEEFQTILEKNVGLEKDIAKKVAQEINRFIFYPVKPALEQLYKMEITPSEKPTEKPEVKEKKPATPPKEDTYREPIE